MINAKLDKLLCCFTLLSEAVFTKAFLNQGIISKSDALLVDLAITTLVDQFMHRLQIGITETVK